MTRCKQGETAFFRKGPAENLGHFVTIERLCNNPGIARIAMWRDNGAYWFVKARQPIIYPCGHAHGNKLGDEYCDFVPDDLLTPVRDSDGQDETLAWKPVPAPEELVT